MRRKLVAGNWKMNLHWDEAMTLIAEIIDFERKTDLKKTELNICPPSPYLRHALELIKDRGSKLSLGAQNISEHYNGAFTGELSASMLKALGVDSIIIGHSERRQYFNEGNEVLREKMKLALKENLRVFYCCGETLNEREAGIHFEIIQRQLEEGICKINQDELKNLVIAYEPVWAIGTGLTATPEQAQKVHAFIRQSLTQHYGEANAQKIQILYGGSVKPENAEELFSQPDVDGGLIGGAALKADSFAAIALAAEKV